MGFHRTARHYLDVNRSDEISLNSRINVEPRMVPPISKYKIMLLLSSAINYNQQYNHTLNLTSPESIVPQNKKGGDL
jgi:hypothetical protein